jgi:hypothetical protein
MKQKYYLQFCRSHQHRDSYVTIKASSFENAFKLALAKYGMNFQQVHEADKFKFERYPQGELKVEETC